VVIKGLRHSIKYKLPFVNNVFSKVATQLSGLAHLSFVLRVRGLNPGDGTGEEKEQIPFFELYSISLVHSPVCGLGFGLPLLISHLQWNDQPLSSTLEEWNQERREP
jgi:hypothetical protein